MKSKFACAAAPSLAPAILPSNDVFAAVGAARLRDQAILFTTFATPLPDAREQKVAQTRESAASLGSDADEALFS
jgi:hypothetical protein